MRSMLFLKRPPSNFLKLIFDGAKRGSSNTSLGFVFRDENGKMLMAGAKALHPEGSILFVEVFALREGI